MSTTTHSSSTPSVDEEKSSSIGGSSVGLSTGSVASKAGEVGAMGASSTSLGGAVNQSDKAAEGDGKDDEKGDDAEEEEEEEEEDEEFEEIALRRKRNKPFKVLIRLTNEMNSKPIPFEVTQDTTVARVRTFFHLFFFTCEVIVSHIGVSFLYLLSVAYSACSLFCCPIPPSNYRSFWSSLRRRRVAPRSV